MALIIPEPNAEGCYSTILAPKYERILIEGIREATVHITSVDSTNAGELLFICWTEQKGFGQDCPSCFSTLQNCIACVSHDPDLVTLLAEVRRRKAYSWLCEYLAPPSPLLDDADITKLLESVEPEIRKILTTYLEDNVSLPVWKPQSGSDAIQSHITQLKIPTTIASSKRPSLLLHNLGQLSHDPHLIERVNDLFRPGCQPRFLCNTSGSGKTRLLLEGLWRNWGFYFTARTQPEGIGSKDLETVFQELEQRQRLIAPTEENGNEALLANREARSRRFLLLLYVRAFVFRIFIECASAMCGEISENHKSRWLLLQVDPQLLAQPDIFLRLNLLLRKASFSHLQASIALELFNAHRLLGHASPVFCVLDEAQVPTNKFSDYFLSQKQPVQRRPILREIIFAWTPICENLILSGTRVSTEELETVLGSVVAKEGGSRPETFTDLGAFDDEDTQRVYLEQYPPPGFLDTIPGKLVASRVAYWLHGRHRFMATYISHLIQANFESPHRVLNDLVYGLTNFHPSDHDGGEPLELKLEKPRGFHFSKLKQDEALLRQIAGFLFDYIFNGKPRLVGGPKNEKLVEYGIARFVDHRNLTADEPLALLAAVHYFTTETRWSLPYLLLEGVTAANESARGISFEQLGAYLLGLAFKAPRRLSTVFTFVGEHSLELGNEVGRLVAMENANGEFVCSPVDISSNTGPTYILGRSPNTEMKTLAWLENPQRTVFCFPANTVGPDLILVLGLSNDRVVRVVIQFKHRRSINAKDTADGFRTTDPKLFLSRRASSSPSIPNAISLTQGTISQPSVARAKNPGLNQKFQDALLKLGTGTEKAGDLGVLRVLIAYPGTPDSATLTSLANGDTSRHPTATVDVKLLAMDLSKDHGLESLTFGVEAAAKQMKRKSDDHAEIPGAKRKRSRV